MKKVGEIMESNLKALSKKIAVSSANTACHWWSYQAKEPETLQKFKKLK